MDALRGGILRWLWGLGKEVLVGVLAAYNNASYPLTIGPLLPAPTTASELEDQVRLLPLEEEVEDGVYGGHYCLTCVLAQATKVSLVDSKPMTYLTLVFKFSAISLIPSHC